MSFDGQPKARMDPALQQFIQMQSEKQKIQAVIHKLNDKCWDTCYDGVKPSTKVDSKTETCIRNCVDRFLDANILVTKRTADKARELQQGMSGQFQ